MKKFKLIHKTGKIFKDKRGSLQKILEGEFSSCIEVHSKKGSTRANHYHKKDKHFMYIISGELLYSYKDRKKGSKVKIKKMKKGDLFFTPAMLIVWGIENFGLWSFLYSIPQTINLLNLNISEASKTEMTINHTRNNNNDGMMIDGLTLLQG